MVIDNGVGIAKKTQDSLLYTFKNPQGDMSHGVGIGLSTARALTDALGGTIKIKSQKKLGTTITFTTLVNSKSIKKITQKELNEQISPPKMIIQPNQRAILAAAGSSSSSVMIS